MRLGMTEYRASCFRRFLSLFIFTVFAILEFQFLPFNTLQPAHAQVGGGVSVSPQRIVFEGRTRSSQVTLINNSTKPVTYRISFKNMQMKEDGTFVQIDKPQAGGRFADKLIRYSPREVTVPGKGTQTVRLMVRKPRDLEEGEYRSHMLFKALPPPDAGADIETLTVKKGEIKISIIPILSISIPIIVRHGKLSATVGLADLKIVPPSKPENPSRLGLKVTREGTSSAYGDISVQFQPGSGDEVEVGLVRGVAVYVPNKGRTLQVLLNPPQGVVLKGGTLRVTFRDRPESGGAVLAKAELSVP